MSNQTMSSASIVFRTLAVLAGFFLLAWLCAACGGAPETSPGCGGASAPACTVHEAPAGCLEGFQAYAVECSEPAPNPAGEACKPAPDASGIMREVDGKASVWCCK